MSRIKRVALCALAAFTLSAIFASAASAASPAWLVAGSPLATGETEAIAETTEVTRPFVIATALRAIECPSVKFEEAYIEGEKTRKEKAIILEGCTVPTQPSCTVATIKTKPLTATLEGTVGNYKLNFKPTSGTEVATITFSGSGCSGSFVITGSMACDYPEVEEEKQKHILQFTASSGSKLKRGTEEVTLSGEDVFWLSSWKKWSVM